MRWLLAGAVGLGAFLLFLVQPLIGKFILPWFGGAPAVWVVCMVFFQGALLAGYLYAHGLARWRVPRWWRAGVHITLLVVAVALLPIAPAERWRPEGGGGDPTWRILLMLATSVGLAFVLLSATTPLVQAWWTRSGAGGEGVYRLYAVSNVASFAALIAYPVAVEPYLGRRGQAVGWSWGFAIYAMLMAAAVVIGNRRRDQEEEVREPSAPVRRWVRVAWVALPAIGVMMMLATTSRIGQEVAPVPLLWVVPLGLYLLTYVWAFARRGGYRWGVWAGLFAVSAVGVVVVTLTGRWVPTVGQLLIYLAAMFAGCMVCHGEVARLKPAAGEATGYYVALSAGGALGGVLVGLVAPLVFKTYAEYPLVVIACGVIAGMRAFLDPKSRLYRGRPAGAWLAIVTAGFVTGWLLLAAQSATPGEVIEARRNFYGSLQVVEEDAGTPNARRSLRHGRVTHGMQLIADDAARRRPTTYYGPTSGIGRVLGTFRVEQPRRVGVIGLGIGSIAAWARAGDTWRCYEINPDVRALAEAHFTYLRDCPGRVEHAAGDARLVLEREADQRFDVLVVDAFAGDAIPAHLLTREAFAVYRRHLAPGGVIAVHVTNRHLDLRPVARAGAEGLGMAARWFHDPHPVRDVVFSPSDWVIVGDAGWVDVLPEGREIERAVVWTDDATGLFPLLH